MRTILLATAAVLAMSPIALTPAGVRGNPSIAANPYKEASTCSPIVPGLDQDEEIPTCLRTTVAAPGLPSR